MREPKGFISWADAPSIAPDRVKVYYNLRYDCLSVVDTSTGKLYCHSHRVELKDAKFHVNENGRQRVVREKRKNVHAYVVGKWVTEGDHQAYRYVETGYSDEPGHIHHGDMTYKKVWDCNCHNEGEFVWCEKCIPESGEEFKGAYYNPYKHKTFVEDVTKKPVYKSERVVLRDKTAIGPHYNIFYIPEPKPKRVPWNKGKTYTFKEMGFKLKDNSNRKIAA